MKRAAAGAVCLGLLVLAGRGRAEEITRLPLLGSDFPISSAVTVRAGTDMVFLSGALGPTVDPAAPKGAKPSWGTTEVQTNTALATIKGTLARLGLGMGDVIKMTVFLAGDPAHEGKMDFPGLMAGYTKYFGTKEQPNKPARSAVQVAALAAPGALVEIEVIAAYPH